MKTLSNSEIWNRSGGSVRGTMAEVFKQMATQGNDCIYPSNIEIEVLTLKAAEKNSSLPLVKAALDLYENHGGIIRLFKQPRVPSYIPLVPGVVKRWMPADVHGNTPNRLDPMFRGIYISMNGAGEWTSDRESFKGLNPKTDLYAALESGYVMYHLLINDDASKRKALFDSKIFIESITRIYVGMFMKALIKTTKSTSIGADPFMSEALRFTIARFFLLYIMERPDDASTDGFAHLILKNRNTTLGALKAYTENLDIDYSSISGFIKSLIKEFYYVDIEYDTLLSEWTKLYGPANMLAIEVLPFLIHAMLCACHNASFGANNRLSGSTVNEIKNNGLYRVYGEILKYLK